MKNALKLFLAIFAISLSISSCQTDEQNPNTLDNLDLVAAENESVAESVFEDVDDIGYESLFYIEEGGRTYVDEESPIHCAVRTHDKDNKTITIDYGDGCEGKFGRIRSGKIIITYTNRIYMPGAVVTTTFDNYVCDGKQIEGTRIRTNISESTEENIKFRIVLEGGKITDEDGSTITREADWEVTRVRTANPINDERIRTGSASGTESQGRATLLPFTDPIVWKRGCLTRPRMMIPVQGSKTKEYEDGMICMVDYGDGECE